MVKNVSEPFIRQPYQTPKAISDDFHDTPQARSENRTRRSRLSRDGWRRIHRHQHFGKRRCGGKEQQKQKEEDSLHGDPPGSGTASALSLPHLKEQRK